ncbi:DUF1579 family protein [Deinococcus oregonensis]|uniref:DUF1579 family protein n=1 Tax=Deinococcus oregonensis TaxID=1805970 RepID=A0ABV6ASL1_9DEIO
MHARLAPLVGTWRVTMRVWPAPGAQPLLSDDFTATRAWILGGRYLQENLQGTLAGNPSSRVMFLSYNNLEQRYELATMDSFEPGQMWYTSRTDGLPGRIELYGTSAEAGSLPEPTGRLRNLRFELELTDARSVERIYAQYPGQAEFLFVEQVFTRP